MNVLVVSPQFPPQFFRFCAALKARGLTALGMGDTPWEALAPELRASLDDYAYVPGLAGNYDGAARAVGWLISRHGRIDRVESHNEFWLGLDAQLREDFNIPGPKPALLESWRTKSGMAELFDKAGIPRPEGIVTESKDALRAFAKKHGYPLIFKPNQGVGAAATFRVEDDAQLAAALDQPLGRTIVQPFITGSIVSYDGLIDGRGRIVFETSHEYSAGIMEVVNGRLDVSYWSVRQIPTQLKDYGLKTLAGFGLRERFFHIEFFRMKDGSHRALEVNVRPPGGFTTDIMNFTCDIDVYALWAQMIAGDDLAEFKYSAKYSVCHASRRNERRYKASIDECVARLGDRLLLHRPMPEVLAGAMGDYMFLFRSPDLDVVKADTAFIQALA